MHTAPRAKSFIGVPPEHHFPIQNLPYGVFKPRNDAKPRVGVRIGDHVLDLAIIERSGLLRDAGLGGKPVFSTTSLNAFMERGHSAWHGVRARVCDLLRHDNPVLRDDVALRRRSLRPIDRVELCIPVEVGDYTDFYSSRHHAINVGTMFRGRDDALTPNYQWLPIGYHGRAGSIVLSGTPVRRPRGQTKSDAALKPRFGPSRAVDFELEMGFFVGGPATQPGDPIPIEKAEERIFGLTLVNDWSARDIQKWEYVPLGPFLAKNFATTISPWVVPLEALAPFRCEGPQPEHEPLDYLKHPAQHGTTITRGWTYDIRLEVGLQTAKLDSPLVVCRSNFKYLYWSMVQQLAHHTVSGCNVRPGDLMASGTISGPTPGSFGSMLELAWKGERPMKLPNGEQRRFLEDGDTVIMRAWCEGDGYRIGFGDCTGTLLTIA